MNNDQSAAISSEINELVDILDSMPKKNVIERIGLQSRLANAKAELEDIKLRRLARQFFKPDIATPIK